MGANLKISPVENARRREFAGHQAHESLRQNLAWCQLSFHLPEEPGQEI